MSEEVNRRNIVTLAEHAKRIDTQLQIVDEKVKHLEAVIAQLNAKVQQQEQFISFIRIKMMGTGPTV
jgi:phage shock protein A